MPTSQDLQDHLAFALADNRRKTEVSIRNLNAEERKLMEAAKDKEVDQWIFKLSFQNSQKGRHPNQTHHGNEMDLDLERSPRRDQSKSTTSCKRIHRP